MSKQLIITEIKGDFRYRSEMTDDHAVSDSRDRNRIQARVGTYGKVNDKVDFGFRPASGNNASPTSNNQYPDNGFSSKDIRLDLLFKF